MRTISSSVPSEAKSFLAVNLRSIPHKNDDQKEIPGTGNPRAKTGAKGSRTPDLVIANDALYQLSYDPGSSYPAQSNITHC